MAINSVQHRYLCNNNMLDGNLGSLLYGDVSVMKHTVIKAVDSKTDTNPIEPLCEKTGLRGFRRGPTQTGLCSHRILLET